MLQESPRTWPEIIIWPFPFLPPLNRPFQPKQPLEGEEQGERGQGLLLEEDCLFSTVYSCPRLTDHASMGLFPGFIFYSINLCVYFCAKNCVYFKFEKKNCGNLASYLLGKNSKLASPELILINVLLSIHGRAGAGACFSSHGDRFAVVIHILSPVPRAGQENIFYYDWPA